MGFHLEVAFGGKEQVSGLEIAVDDGGRAVVQERQRLRAQQRAQERTYGRIRLSAGKTAELYSEIEHSGKLRIVQAGGLEIAVDDGGRAVVQEGQRLLRDAGDRL